MNWDYLLQPAQLGILKRVTTTTSAFVSGICGCHISSVLPTISRQRRDNTNAVEMLHQMSVCVVVVALGLVLHNQLTSLASPYSECKAQGRHLRDTNNSSHVPASASTSRQVRVIAWEQKILHPPKQSTKKTLATCLWNPNCSCRGKPFFFWNVPRKMAGMRCASSC